MNDLEYCNKKVQELRNLLSEVNKVAYCVKTCATHAQNNYSSAAVRDIQRRNKDMEFHWGLKRVQKNLDRVQELNHQMLERIKDLTDK